MKKTLLCLIITLIVTTSKLFAEETIIMRCFLLSDTRMEVYYPGGKYEKIELPKWSIKDDKAVQLTISKKIEELNKQGFSVVSFNEAVSGTGFAIYVSTYILIKK